MCYAFSMTEHLAKIDITGKVKYSDEITIAQAAQIIAFLNAEPSGSIGAGLAAPFLGSTSQHAIPKKVENAREALDVSGAQRNPEKIVALGAYVLEDGGETFKVEDIKTQFRRARETLPGNLPRDLNKAIASGWIAEDKPGEYYLTSKVLGVLDGGFSFPKNSNGGRTRAVKRASVKAGKPETLADIDEFPATMEGYAPYSKMKSGKDRVLWVLLLMRDVCGRNGLTNKEIEYISDSIGIGVPNANITAAFSTAKSQGFASRSTQDKSLRITENGAKYLATVGAKAEA